jgi:hypothetical protein
MNDDQIRKAAEELAKLQDEMAEAASKAPKTGGRAMHWAFDYARPKAPFETDPFSAASGVRIKKG